MKHEEGEHKLDCSTWMKAVIWFSWAIRIAAWVRAINQFAGADSARNESAIHVIVLAIYLSMWSIESALHYVSGVERCVNPKLDLSSDILVAAYAAWMGLPFVAIGIAIIVYQKARIYRRGDAPSRQP